MSQDPEKNIQPISKFAKPIVAGAFILSGLVHSTDVQPDHNVTPQEPVSISNSGLDASGGSNGSVYHMYQDLTKVGKSFEKDISAMDIPSSVNRFMDANTVYMSGDGCSGTIIRDGNQISGKPIGIAFAKHCGFIPYVPKLAPWTAANYITGSNGKEYKVNQMVFPETGTKLYQNMISLNEVKEVIVPKDNNNTIDQAFGILPGATAKEVLDKYKSESLTESEIHKNLVPGKTVVYMRGWPVNQGGNNPENLRSQEFAMVYIGLGENVNAVGEDLQFVMTAIPKVDTKVDNAVCSFGASGSGGFIMEGDKAKQIGPLSVFWGLTPLVGEVDNSVYNNKLDPEENRLNFEQLYPNIDWSNYSAVCGFAYKKINEHKVVNIVPSQGDIPGQINQTEYSEYKMQEDFSNPNYVKKIVDGTVVVSQSSEDKGAIYPSSTIINKPIIEVDPKTGHVFVGYYDGQPGINVIEVDNLDQLEFFQQSWNKPLGLIHTKGKINQSNDYRHYKFALVNSHGLKFGELLYGLTNPDSKPYSISLKNSKIAFVDKHLSQLPQFITQNPNFYIQ